MEINDILITTDVKVMINGEAYSNMNASVVYFVFMMD